ncbi:MAG: hypothetical protein M1813_008306 [Trichoglossum hirsutum]|nr:MAG: hypothetical protein M1813_008306 [Trichoglossum hirsutum]
MKIKNLVSSFPSLNQVIARFETWADISPRAHNASLRFAPTPSSPADDMPKGATKLVASEPVPPSGPVSKTVRPRKPQTWADISPRAHNAPLRFAPTPSGPADDMPKGATKLIASEPVPPNSPISSQKSFVGEFRIVENEDASGNLHNKLTYGNSDVLMLDDIPRIAKAVLSRQTTSSPIDLPTTSSFDAHPDSTSAENSGDVYPYLLKKSVSTSSADLPTTSSFDTSSKSYMAGNAEDTRKVRSLFSKLRRPRIRDPVVLETQSTQTARAQREHVLRDAWTRKSVEPEEVQELLRYCTTEIKSRALHFPFLLLPFRPTSDPSAARTFIRYFFNSLFDRSGQFRGESLMQELRLIEPIVLCSVVKWCWSRLPGGVVTWEAYELFCVDSNMARDSFATFIPLSVDSEARNKIIFDFFDLMAAIAAHGKMNGLGGRKLSRFAGWWAFEHSDGSNGFEGGYKSWASAADAASHLFFAYLRSTSLDAVKVASGIHQLPISLQNLMNTTEYPPITPSLMQTPTTRVAMIVDSVSPTPFALLRRAKHFEFRFDDRALKEFAEYEDQVQALTDECRRVLRCISSTNQSTISSSGIRASC